LTRRWNGGRCRSGWPKQEKRIEQNRENIGVLEGDINQQLRVIYEIHNLIKYYLSPEQEGESLDGVLRLLRNIQILIARAYPGVKDVKDTGIF
jgi:hypothetical protein